MGVVANGAPTEESEFSQGIAGPGAVPREAIGRGAGPARTQGSQLPARRRALAARRRYKRTMVAIAQQLLHISYVTIRDIPERFRKAVSAGSGLRFFALLQYSGLISWAGRSATYDAQDVFGVPNPTAFPTAEPLLPAKRDHGIPAASADCADHRNLAKNHPPRAGIIRRITSYVVL